MTDFNFDAKLDAGLAHARRGEEVQKREFLDFALTQKALCFGEFTLKSGRVSPYFYNAGLFNTGRALAILGFYYAQAAVRSGFDFDMVFGPAYKGIPLATATAVALADHHGLDVPWCFNRKEAKDHGEGGDLVGAPLAGRVLIIDDVITAGTAVGESMQLLERHGATPAAVLIALDRQERGKDSDCSAIQEVETRYGVPVISIANLDELFGFLVARGKFTEAVAINAYRNEYGVVPKQ